MRILTIFYQYLASDLKSEILRVLTFANAKKVNTIKVDFTDAKKIEQILGLGSPDPSNHPQKMSNFDLFLTKAPAIFWL